MHGVSDDIALLRLCSEVSFDDVVQPVALESPGRRHLDGDRVHVAGWGTLRVCQSPKACNNSILHVNPLCRRAAPYPPSFATPPFKLSDSSSAREPTPSWERRKFAQECPGAERIAVRYDKLTSKLQKCAHFFTISFRAIRVDLCGEWICAVVAECKWESSATEEDAPGRDFQECTQASESTSTGSWKSWPGVRSKCT